MKALTIVWNESGEECVGFSDAADARFAAGGRPPAFHNISGLSDLAEYFREGYSQGATLENVVAVGAEGIEGLRQLRLHHWNCAIQLTPHIDRHVNRDLSCASVKQVERNSDTLSRLQQIKARHLNFVQFLNDFFEIGDTAEKDADK